MPAEIRTGQLIGWFFLVPCTVAVSGTLWLAREQPLFLVLSALFGAGMLAGASLLLRPPLLLRVQDGCLELYAGTLGGNPLQASIPVAHLDRYKVHHIHDDEGVTWVLTLHLNTPADLSERARARIRLAARFTKLPTSDDRTIHWPLGWPAGGAAKADERLRRLLDPLSAPGS